MSQSRGDTSGSTDRLLRRLRFIEEPDNPTVAAVSAPPTRQTTLAGKTVNLVDDYSPSATSTDEAPVIPSWRRKLQTTSDLDDSLVIMSGESFVSEPVLSDEEAPVQRRSTTELKADGGKVPDTISFHKTSLYRITRKDKTSLVFFKENTPNSWMSELEALAVGFFRLIAPNHFPPARAYIDKENRYVGVSSAAIPNFVTLKKSPLTAADLENKKIVEDLAVILTTSYLMREDDLHSENISKHGYRIDGDMLLWHILCKFKPSGYGTNWLFRTPDATTHAVTANDIRNFPDIQDAHPFYWPTRAIPSTYKFALNVVKALGVSLSKDYQEEERVLFKSLKDNKWFNYVKFKTLLKYILTDAKMYRKIANLHMRDTLVYESKNLIDLIVTEEAKRINQFRHVLVNMPEFKSFLEGENGQLALAEIIAEFEIENNKITEKLRELGEDRKQHDTGEIPLPDRKEETYADLKINTEEINLRYREICDEVFEDKLEASRLWVKV